ncbi:ATPase, histidine kinase-, DNA gyrase B-, and HSP90-like domain protein [Verrucomicrobiia bacterium DG1235]|nr:ATPase, histidine kinase-, DNA gyrase B-, and HSP90-like domain protein [Verrucomicrobiae bacterium DG1235]
MNPADNNFPLARSRSILYASLGFVLLSAPFALRSLEWQTNEQLHAIAEIVAATLALATSAVSFRRYYVKRELPFQIIAVSFLGVSLLDGFHASISWQWAKDIFPSETPSLSAWTWLASKIFLSGTLLFSCLYCLRQKKLGPAGNLQDHHIFIGTLAISILSGLFFAFLPLPGAYIEKHLIGRPAEFLPVLIFIAALLAFLKKGDWKRSSFEHWLILALIINIAAHTVVMPFSTKLYDIQFNCAHILKILGYGFILKGVLTKTPRPSATQNLAIPATSGPNNALEAKAISNFNNSSPTRLGVAPKLILGTSLMVAFVAGTIGFMAFSSFSNAIEEGEISYLKTKAQQSSALLTSELESLRQETSFLSKTPPVQGLIRAEKANGYDELESSSSNQWRERLATIFIHKLESNPTLLQIRYIGVKDQGKELVRVERVDGEIALVPDEQLQSKGDQAYLINGLKTPPGEVYLSEVELNREWGKIALPHTPTIRGITPIYGEDRSLFGAIVLNLDLSLVFDLLKRANSETSKIHLTNERGEYLLHPDPNRAFTFEFGGFDSIFSDYPSLEHPNNSYSSISVKQYNSNADGQRAVGLVSIPLDSGEPGRTLILALSTSMREVIKNSPINPTLALATGLVVLGIALIFAWLFSVSITQPLRYISWAAETYGTSGKLVPLPTESKGEVGVLARSLQSLHGQIEERTAELRSILNERRETNEKLLAAMEEATQATEAKSQFLATMSHEIRTPMNGLIGILDLLESQVPTDAKRQLNIAQNSADELLLLINDILDFSKIEAGKLTLESTNFDVIELLESISALHAHNATEKGLEFLCTPSPSAAAVIKGDPHRLRQVLSNLVSNAIKFTSSGEIELGAEIIENDLHSKTLRIYIRDTGIGIEKDHLAQLFKAFRQANASTAREFGGTGLGLSISKKIIEAMRGDIVVESEHGKGSTFFAEIPLPPSQADSACLEPIETAQGKRFLVVDNNKNRACHYVTWLAQWGFKCDIVHKANEAMKSVESLAPNEKFDHILIDSTRYDAHLDFWEETIRQENAFRSSTYFITGKVFANSNPTGKALAPKYLAKPISLFSFKQLLTPTNNVNRLPETPPNEEPSYEQLDLSAHKVLLVDDNATNRLIIRQYLLRNHKVKPDEAEDGLEALERLKETKYDLVFMDVMMPNMDGYRATLNIRDGATSTENQNVPIIAITAHARDEDKKNCIDCGMSDHIAKPVRQEDIALSVSKWLG